MLEDFINTESDEQFIEGLTISVVKRNIVKTSEESVTTKNLVFLLIKSGRFKIRVREIAQELSAHDLVILPKNSHCLFTEIKDKFQLFLISFSSESAFKNLLKRKLVDSFYFFVRSEPVKITLEEKEFLVLSLIYKLIFYINKDRSRTDFDFELRRIGFNLFLYQLRLIYAKHSAETRLHFSKKENMVLQFLTVLSIHSKKHHNVKFYAGALFVTPDHLNKTVKEITGKPAKKIIIEAILAEAISLLEDSQYTIAQIAEELDFTSVSEFSRFFKKFILFSPSEYRSNAIERFKSR